MCALSDHALGDEAADAGDGYGFALCLWGRRSSGRLGAACGDGRFDILALDALAWLLRGHLSEVKAGGFGHALGDRRNLRKGGCWRACCRRGWDRGGLHWCLLRMGSADVTLDNAPCAPAARKLRPFHA